MSVVLISTTAFWMRREFGKGPNNVSTLSQADQDLLCLSIATAQPRHHGLRSPADVRGDSPLYTNEAPYLQSSARSFKIILDI